MLNCSIANKSPFQQQDFPFPLQPVQRIARSYSFPDLEIFNNALQSRLSSPVKFQRNCSSISFSPVTEIDASPIEMHNSYRRYMPSKLRKEIQKPAFYYNPFSARKSADKALESSGYDADVSSNLSSLTTTPIKRQTATPEPDQKNHLVCVKRTLYLNLGCLQQEPFNKQLADEDEAPRIQRHFQADLFSK